MSNQRSDYSLNARSIDGLDSGISDSRKENKSVDRPYRLPYIQKRWDNVEAYFDISKINNFNKGKFIPVC